MKIEKKKLEPRQRKLVLVMLAVALVCVLIFVVGLCFTGEVTCTYTDTALQVTSSYVSGVELAYEEIDSVELRQDFDFGTRGYGLGTVRLATGAYQNDEFEAYTLYAYKSCTTVVLIHCGEKVLAVNGKTEAATQAIYDALQSKIG